MDLRSALEDAFNQETEFPESTVAENTPAVTTDKPVDDFKSRDEAGRFAKAPIEQVKDAPIGAPEPAPVAEPPPERKAPSSWKPEAQSAFLKADRGEALTPEEVKLLTAEAERREGDFHKGVADFKSHADRARAYDQAVAPYQSTLKSLNVDAPTAISALLKADHILRNSDPATKSQYFGELARQYGIDLGQVQQPQQVDPQQQYLMQQLHELRQTQQMWQNQVQEQQKAQAEQELSSFAANAPHLEAVRADMATLLESGTAKSLQEAYDKAVWMNPGVRQSLIETERREAQRKAAEVVHANKARTANVSVKTSSPAGGGNATSNSIRDLLESNFN